MKYVILTEASQELGFGHLTRCSALMQALNEQGQMGSILVEGQLPSQKLLSENITTHNWMQLDEYLAIELTSCDFIVLDSFLANPDYIAGLSLLNQCIIFIDDFIRRDYQLGMVVDWTIGAEVFAYPKRNSEVQYLLGVHWACLRQPFRDFHVEKTIAKNINHVLIIFGGADVKNLVVTCVDFLNEHFPEFTIHAITRPGAIVRPHSNRVNYYHSCSDVEMQYLMATADVAISAGGQTLYELVSCGVPTIAVSVVDDQQEDILNFFNRSAIYSLGSYSESKFLNNLKNGIYSLKSEDVRKSLSKNAQSLIDGMGAFRLAERIIKYGSRH